MIDWRQRLPVIGMGMLGAGIVALGGMVAVLERRIAALESQMGPRVPLPATRVVLPPGMILRAPQSVPERERRPSGEINGTPYYLVPLVDARGS